MTWPPALPADNGRGRGHVMERYRQANHIASMLNTNITPVHTNPCPSCGASPLENEGPLDAAKQTSPSATDAAHFRAAGLDLREKALLIREEAIEERENDLRRREALFAVQQGKSFALRVQEISDAQIAKATREYRHSQLKEADDKLIVAAPVRDGEQ